MKCRKCKGSLEPTTRAGQFIFNFCRACKLPHNEYGVPIFDSGLIKSFFNAPDLTRSIIGKTHAGMNPVARTAFEVLLMQGMVEAYMAGVKDGVLLAYSQDVGEGEPVGLLRSASDNPEADH